jgi:diaminopimelate epimerase
VEIPSIPFSKYHGIGNDFILIDNRESDTPLLNAEQCKEVGMEAGREGG